MSLMSSFIQNHDRVMTYAKKVSYPYLIVLGEKDVIVSNDACRSWHSKTSTPAKHKEMKLMAQSYHELSKEPNRNTLFEPVLKFFIRRLKDQEKPAQAFGQLDPKKDVKIAVKIPFWKKKKFWIMISIIYLFIGMIYAIVRRKTKLFLSWPALLVIAKRLK